MKATRRVAFTLIAIAGCCAGSSGQQAPELCYRRSVLIPPPPETGERWLPGVHYSVLSPRVYSQDSKAGKIEVLEFFMYTSPAAEEFQPYLRKWLASKPSYIEYRRRPAIVFPHARAQARIYFTLRKLGREDLHSMLFAWIRQPQQLKVFHREDNPDEDDAFALSLGFARANGLNVKRFSEIYRSKKMNSDVIQAEIDQHEYHVIGTSTVCVDGGYCTSAQRLASRLGVGPEPKDYERLLRLVDYLAISAFKAANKDPQCRG